MTPIFCKERTRYSIRVEQEGFKRAVVVTENRTWWGISDGIRTIRVALESM